VGKLWSEKPTNKEAFKTVFSRIWRLIGTVVFKELQDHLWLFEFSDAGDKRRVLAGRPWAFDRQILVINEFDGKTPPSMMDFTSTPIWVQVHEMPLLCMSRAVGTKIGESLGKLEDVDLAGDGAGWGRCLRLRVHIDLTKPLERGRALHLDGQSYWVMFKYEKLPRFCFFCGRVVHGRLGCPVRRDSTSHVAEEKKEWGTWLRVDVRRPLFRMMVGSRLVVPERRRSMVRRKVGWWGGRLMVVVPHLSVSCHPFHNYVVMMVGLVRSSRDRVAMWSYKMRLSVVGANCQLAHVRERKLSCHVLL
jgi:hypothetical protein